MVEYLRFSRCLRVVVISLWIVLAEGICTTSIAHAQPSIPKERIPRSIPTQVRKRLEQLYSDNAKTRCKASESLGRMGKKAKIAVPFLASMLSDKSSYPLWLEGDMTVTECVASALGQLGDPGFEVLVAALREGEPNVRARAAQYLGNSRNPRAIPALVEALWQEGYGDHNEIRFARDGMVFALGKLAAIEPLIEALRDERIRFGVQQELAGIGRAVIIPLIEALQDSNPDIQGGAAKVLRDMTGEDFGLDATRWQSWWKKHGMWKRLRKSIKIDF